MSEGVRGLMYVHLSQCLSGSVCVCIWVCDVVCQRVRWVGDNLCDNVDVGQSVNVCGCQIAWVDVSVRGCVSICVYGCQ